MTMSLLLGFGTLLECLEVKKWLVFPADALVRYEMSLAKDGADPVMLEGAGSTEDGDRHKKCLLDTREDGMVTGGNLAASDSAQDDGVAGGGFFLFQPP
jgi:hypothetical protein